MLEWTRVAGLFVRAERFAGVFQPIDRSDNESTEGVLERGGLAWLAKQSRPLTLKIAGTKRECI